MKTTPATRGTIIGDDGSQQQESKTDFREARYDVGICPAARCDVD